MKTITKTLIILVCLLSTNLSMAASPEKKAIEIKKAKLINKIRRSVSQPEFVAFMKCGHLEQIVLKCNVNENGEVVVSRIIGVNEDLKKAILAKMEKRNIRTSKALCGQELAFRVSFKKLERLYSER